MGCLALIVLVCASDIELNSGSVKTRLSLQSFFISLESQQYWGSELPKVDAIAGWWNTFLTLFFLLDFPIQHDDEKRYLNGCTLAKANNSNNNKWDWYFFKEV